MIFDVEAADAVLQAGVSDGLWPGIVAAVGVRDQVQRQWVLGHAERYGDVERPMSEDTVFDLASLTKVIATMPTVLLLVQDGRLQLTDSAATWLPDIDPRITVKHLLTHTSGLPAHVDLLPDRAPGSSSADALIAAAAATPLVAEPGTRVAYSDLGFVLLGGVVAAVTGSALETTVQSSVFEPLGIAASYRLPASWLPRIAATEVISGRPVLGRVHDENAAAAGAPVGHAGLFGTLADLRAYLPVWWPAGALLDDELRTDAMRDHTAGLPEDLPADRRPPQMADADGHRGLGWTCRGDRFDILSPAWGQNAVSHTGFTGTSLVLDSSTGRWAVLLTNAVHFGRGRPAVLAARRRFHAALVGD